MLNIIVWGLVVILYFPVFSNLYHIRWDTIDYTHAYFILPISIWLVWRKRIYLTEIYQNNNKNNNFLLSFFSIIIGFVMYLFGWRQDYIFIQTLSLIPLLFGITGYLYGSYIAKSLSFPILYLLLLVPLPAGILDSITFPLRQIISAATESILSFASYPISRKGLLLTIGYQDIFMGEPCSGFRSLITMFSLVLVYVYISKSSLANKVVLTSVIIPMAMLGNLVRVITLCLITFYFGEEAGQGFFHNFSGIVIFIITLLGVMGVEQLLGIRHEKV